MSDPLPLGKKSFNKAKKIQKQAIKRLKNSKMLFFALFLILFGSLVRLFGPESTPFAEAYADSQQAQVSLNSPLFEQKSGFFDQKNTQISTYEPLSIAQKSENQEVKNVENVIADGSNENFANKIYAIVGDAPIKEMVPFISQKDQKVAAFLVGIAKKESSFGSASPSKDGKTCYNYWGYKGSGERGQGMGYACFASAQEAVDTVGGKIATLVEKNRSTPAKMVDTWKCGTSCAGDPGAPGWISTVALYFNQLVDQNI